MTRRLAQPLSLSPCSFADEREPASIEGIPAVKRSPSLLLFRAAPQLRTLPPSWYTSDGVITAMAPMVGQSDLPFRTLCRRYGVSLVYSEMLMAERFVAEAGYRIRALGAGGVRSFDHPLVVQFAANDPAHFVEAALLAQAAGADGVDLNLGCPQTRAREQHFGSYLTDPEEWELCCAIVRAAASHPDLRVPVTVKLRLQPRKHDTCRFALMLANAGASLVAVHGRARGHEDRRRDGSADLSAIAAVVEALQARGVPVLSNGNVRETDNIVDNLLATGAEGIMVAEHLLRDPGVFRRAGFEVNGGAATAPEGRKALAEAYVCLVEEVAGLSEAPLMLEDGSRPVRRGDKAPRVVEEEGEEFERHSVWWANVEVVKSHLGSILGGAGG